MVETLTPTTHNVFNELDSQGLLYTLPRLEGEKNAAYKQRLLDIFAHRGSSTYLGLINGITRELGLSITTEFTFTFTKNSDNTPVLAEPAIVIDESVITLYSNYSASTIAAQFDTWETTSTTYTIGQLAAEINKVAGFSATLKSNANTTARSATLFNQSSIKLVKAEVLSTKGTVIRLDNDYIVNNSVSIDSPSLKNRVYSQAAVLRAGDYYVDITNGFIYTKNGAGPGSTVWYRYLDDTMRVKSSPVIIHNLQSDVFKNRMFQQETGSDGVAYDGMPTPLGADLINELMSVFPTKYEV